MPAAPHPSFVQPRNNSLPPSAAAPVLAAVLLSASNQMTDGAVKEQVATNTPTAAAAADVAAALPGLLPALPRLMSSSGKDQGLAGMAEGQLAADVEDVAAGGSSGDDLPPSNSARLATSSLAAATGGKVDAADTSTGEAATTSDAAASKAECDITAAAAATRSAAAADVRAYQDKFATTTGLMMDVAVSHVNAEGPAAVSGSKLDPVFSGDVGGVPSLAAALGSLQQHAPGTVSESKELTRSLPVPVLQQHVVYTVQAHEEEDEFQPLLSPRLSSAALDATHAVGVATLRDDPYAGACYSFAAGRFKAGRRSITHHAHHLRQPVYH
jgi:hypothetical protein